MVLPVDDDGNGPFLEWEEPAAFGDQSLWPLDTVLQRLAKEASKWYITAAAQTAKQRDRARSLLVPRAHGTATQDELRDWLARTESLANRLPLRTSARETMLAAAAAVARQLDWAKPYFVKVPPLGTKADADLHVSAFLWVMDQLRDAHARIELRAAVHRSPNAEGMVLLRKPPPLSKFWGNLFRRCRQVLAESGLPDPPFADVKQIEKRIARLNANLKPGAGPELMQSILGNVLAEAILQGPAMPKPSRNLH